MNKTVPLARKNALIVRELADETLVYDLAADQAYCLNLTAARVWKNCDGQRTVAQLGELLRTEADSTVPDDIIWLALDLLEKSNLLESAPAKPVVRTQMHRRELTLSIGIAAIAFPVVLTIMVPTAQAQGSSCKNRPCNLPADCCPSNPDCNPSNKCK